ncbi:MAG TPA: fumarylacetoacetate hydrolase family protein [Steroidobacteraceae bacterium]|nr:fumarylacetoacetate hydrolase family protein [Steroidobacteraceae bacterium]
MAFCDSIVPMDVAPYRLTGRVYGTLVNHQSALKTLGNAVHEAPYKGAPQGPVLYIKPRNTLARSGDVLVVPADTQELEVGASLGIVIGRTACALSERVALDFVAGYLIVNDVSVPHSVFYRPSIRFKARDGFCPIGPRVVSKSAVTNPDDLQIDVLVDGALQQSASTKDLTRSITRLLADVTDFMTLAPGDVLTVGSAAPAVRVRAGQSVAIDIEQVGRLTTSFVGGQA